MASRRKFGPRVHQCIPRWKQAHQLQPPNWGTPSSRRRPYPHQSNYIKSARHLSRHSSRRTKQPDASGAYRRGWLRKIWLRTATATAIASPDEARALPLDELRQLVERKKNGMMQTADRPAVSLVDQPDGTFTVVLQSGESFKGFPSLSKAKIGKPSADWQRGGCLPKHITSHF